MYRINLSEVKISENFQRTQPSTKKMNECREYWERNRKQDRPLVINRNGYLIDGYVQYLILQEAGAKIAEAKISDVKMKCYNRMWNDSKTIYVWGKHWNDITKSWSKEYVWKIPYTWQFTDKPKELRVGGLALVNTTRGLQTIVITRFGESEEIPYEGKIKKVRKILGEPVYKEAVREYDSELATALGY